jgi:hypothetical protein
LIYTLSIKENEEYFHTYIDRRPQQAPKPKTQKADGDDL